MLNDLAFPMWYKWWGTLECMPRVVDGRIRCNSYKWDSCVSSFSLSLPRMVGFLFICLLFVHWIIFSPSSSEKKNLTVVRHSCWGMNRRRRNWNKCKQFFREVWLAESEETYVVLTNLSNVSRENTGFVRSGDPMTLLENLKKLHLINEALMRCIFLGVWRQCWYSCLLS